MEQKNYQFTYTNFETFGEKNIFTFFYDASMEGNYFKISEEEFFKP